MEDPIILCTCTSCEASAELPLKNAVSMSKDRADDALEKRTRRGEPRREREPIGEDACIFRRLHASAMLPRCLTEGRGALHEPPAPLHLGELEVVTVDRHDPSEEHPTLEERTSDGSVL